MFKKGKKIKQVENTKTETIVDEEGHCLFEEDDMIRCENLVKIYKTKDIEVMALQGLDLVVKKGELMAIIGNSGSGKSTFLNMVGGLAKPSAGRLYVDGQNLFKLNEKGLVEYKKNTVGFVWQNNARNLFPYLTAQQNVEMPMLFNKKMKNKDTAKKALELLELVGMDDRKDSRLSELSGGQQQRIAIAIALANEPKMLLADEPTGAVDVKTSKQILDVFRHLNEKLGLTIVIVTHDPSLAKQVNRVVRIRDGKITSEQLVKEDYMNRLNEIGNLEDEDTHEEYVVLDRNDRLQLSQEMMEKLNLDGKNVKVYMEGDRIVIEKPES